MPTTLALYLGTAVASHYLASFVQAALHYFLGHRRLGGIFYRTHVFEHHGIYPADSLVSDRYREEKDVSIYYVIPAALLAWLAYLTVPLDLFLVHAASAGLSFAAHVYVHVQYHLGRSWLSRFGWFQRKRRLHFVHHRDMGANFAVLEFVWDRVFGTYRRPDA